jgi:hypothetical protein
MTLQAVTKVFQNELFLSSAEISDCQQYRYRLGRLWGDGDSVCFIGLNPSTADAVADDPTVRRWSHFARAWGRDGFIAVNIFPFRSSSPAECRRWARGETDIFTAYERVGAADYNARRIHETLTDVNLAVACWGAGNWDHEYAEQVLSRANAAGHDIYVFGLTAHGHPIHPMARGKHRVPDDAKPVLWRPARQETIHETCA